MYEYCESNNIEHTIVYKEMSFVEALAGIRSYEIKYLISYSMFNYETEETDISDIALKLSQIDNTSQERVAKFDEILSPFQECLREDAFNKVIKYYLENKNILLNISSFSTVQLVLEL